MLLELAVNGSEPELVELPDRDGQKILSIVENAQQRRRALARSVGTQVPRIGYGSRSYLESAWRCYIHSDLPPVKNWGIH